MAIKLNSSGGGSVTVDAPVTASNLTVTLPSSNGTLATTDGGNTTFTSITDSGNLTFTNTGNRITGDFSNATFSNRVALQSSTTNGATRVNIIPNGTSNLSTLQLISTSSQTSGSQLVVYVDGGQAALDSGITSGGSYVPLTFYTGGSERMHIDTSGNVGIGTSSPYNWGGTSISTGNYSIATTYGVLGANNYYNSGWKYGANGNAWGIGNNFGGTTNGVTIAVTTPNVSGAGAALTWNPAFNIDSSGNVGIGTSSPSSLGAGWQTLEIKGTSGSGSGVVLATSADGTVQTQAYSSSASGYGVLGTRTNHPAIFTTNNTERMRIDSSGNLLVGTTSADLTTPGIWGGSYVASGYGRLNFVKGTASGTGSTSALAFYYNGGVVGTIQCSSTTTSYNTSSDYRLKENIQPMQNALGVVAQLNPVTYTWKTDGSDGQGFIAHELQAVVPDCVTGEKDAVDAEGNPVYQGIDTSFLVATLCKAIQELKAEVDALKNPAA